MKKLDIYSAITIIVDCSVATGTGLVSGSVGFWLITFGLCLTISAPFITGDFWYGSI